MNRRFQAGTVTEGELDSERFGHGELDCLQGAFLSTGPNDNTGPNNRLPGWAFRNSHFGVERMSSPEGSWGVPPYEGPDGETPS
jgi:hypothetical protein